MGAWGYGPFDNDTAGDMCAALAEHVTRVADGHKSGDYESARVAGQFLILSHGTDILGGPGLGEVIRALVRMRCDTAYLAGAREPKKLAAALNKELTIALVRMRACRGCRRVHDKTARKEFALWVEEALGAAVPKARFAVEGRRKLTRDEGLRRRRARDRRAKARALGQGRQKKCLKKKARR